MSEVLFHSVHDLFAAGILRIAAQPPANPRDISGASFLTILLVAGDYPAKTPVMWNAAYREFGLPEVNVVAVADPADTAVILDVFRRDHRYRGGGAGVGFKGAIIPHLDEVTPLARAMGAVNIARNAPAGHLAGDNTDGDGFTRALEQRFLARDTSLQDKRIIILGAGDTAVPIGFALARRGAKPTFLNRTESKAEAAAEA
ncbi:MAG: hypothetical protein Q8R35_01985, partial [bacterium]|nr:hypothetical protein [bacterium]